MRSEIINDRKGEVLVLSADPGKILYCIYNNKKYTGTVLCGYIYEIDGKKLDKPHKMVESDFIEISPYSELIGGQWYDFTGKTYGEIKAEVVKIKYSYDNQIALLINYQNDPENYKEQYDEMQAWRDYASEVAHKYSLN